MILRFLRRGPNLPDPPRNVRLECPDGDVVPVELVYAGKARGLDYWVTPYAILHRHGMQMLVDYMPAKSWVHIWFRLPGEDVREWEGAA